MRSVAALVVLATLVAGGCNGKGENSNTGAGPATPDPSSNVPVKPPEPIKPDRPVDPAFKACNYYYPLVPGAQLQYTLIGSTGLVSDVRVVHSSADENGKTVYIEKTQIVDTGGGQKKLEDTVKKFVCDGERVQLLSWVTDTTVEGAKTRSENKPRREVYVMLDPASLRHTGTKWSYTVDPIFQSPTLKGQTTLDPLPVALEVKGVEEITVPAGKFKALKIVQRVNQNEATMHFVRGLGLVSRALAEGTRMELKEYSGLKPVE